MGASYGKPGVSAETDPWKARISTLIGGNFPMPFFSKKVFADSKMTAFPSLQSFAGGCVMLLPRAPFHIAFEVDGKEQEHA
jgi:hypothetical protein